VNIRDNTGVIVSGIGHLVLIGWALLAPFFQSNGKALPVATTEVSLISAEEFAALNVPQDSQPSIPRAEITPPVPTPSDPAETALPAPAPESEPAVSPPPEPAPVPVPPPEKPPEVEAPPAAPPAEVADTPPDTPAPPPAEQVVIDAPPSDRPTPRAAPRVAPRPAEPAPPKAAPADAVTEEVRPDPEAESPVPEAEAAAPPEATTEIVTEAEKPASAAPQRSLRPRSRPNRPALPAVPVETATPQEPAADAMAEAIAAAVQDANSAPVSGAAAPQEETAAAGPPLSRGEKDALRVAVSRCWNVGSLSSEALATTVVVAVSLSRDGRPKPGTIRMLSASGGTPASARQAFEAARRAILRCGAGGYDLPIGKYDHWRDIEITFNPEKMRIK